MAKTDFKSVDGYIASQPEAVQGALKRVRSIIRKAVPGAEEVISYKIPTYKLHGRPVLYFAGWPSQRGSEFPETHGSRFDPKLRQQEKLAPSGQRARDGFRDVPADEGFAQHVADAGGMCAFGELRAAVAAHENYGNVES